MYRIKALNQSDSELLNASNSGTVEKLIEEIKQQYSVALQAKQNRQYDVAIELFQQILQNDEIAPVTFKSTAREQFGLKYCCYKNLAEIYNAQKSYRMALEMFLQAYAMDNTDVHLMSTFARIALQQRHMEIAGSVFKRCLELNPIHMPSVDGLLEMLCHQEDYFEAFGWANYCHSKFPHYQRAIDVICDVRHLLSDSPLLQLAFSSLPTIIGQRSSKPSLFPSASHSCIPRVDDDNDSAVDVDEPDFNEFRINAIPSFLTFGHMIELIYAKSTQVTSYLTTKLSLGNICDINNVNSDRNNSITAAPAHNLSKPIVAHNFHESCASAAAVAAAAETATMCNNEPITLNTSPIQAIFQESVPAYFSRSNSEENDYDVQAPSFIRAIAQPNYLDNRKIAMMTGNETFHDASASYFYSFIDTLMDDHHFCMLDVMFEWLKGLSKCYHIQLPIEIQSLYINIFEYHCNHTDYNSWERLPHAKICDLFAMEVFFIELNIVAYVRENAVEQLRFFDDCRMQHLHHALCVRHLFIVDCDPILDVRLQLLRLQMSVDMQDYDLANELLIQINAYFTDATGPIELVHLPNQMYCKLVDRWVIASEIKLVECLRLQQQLQQQQQQQPLLLNTFEPSSVLEMLLTHRQCHFESKYLSIFQQFEMLVECHWHAERFDECLYWCEFGLHESIRIWMLERQVCGKLISTQFLQHIRFLAAYLEHFYDENPFVLNSLNKNKERLFRSLAHLLDIQYDDRITAFRYEHHENLPLFNAKKLVNILNLILTSDQDSHAMDTQWAVLNIITKIAEWLILNNIPTWDDGEFLMCVWQMLTSSYTSSSGGGGSSCFCNSIGPQFNWTEIIRLLSHSIYGYPNDIERHCGVCICKRVQIDWNGATLLFISFDSISNGMSQLEQKSLIDDLLNAIPNDLQMNLLQAISQLTNFLNGAIDFPHKYIPMRDIPSILTEIFYRIANIDMDMANYGPYNREQLVAMDLAINPHRFNSWLELLRIKISQFEKLYDATDLTEINIVDVENSKNAIDICFDKCQMLNRAETISTVDHLWRYGLYSFKLCNFFINGDDGTMRNEFNGIYTPKRNTFSWKQVAHILRSYLHSECSSNVDVQHKFHCYFVLGKMAEKQNRMSMKKALKFYLMAEQQLFDQQHDDDDVAAATTDDKNEKLIQTKIEINFRITASIYKFVVRQNANASADDSFADELLQLIQVLQRDKSRLFTEYQLTKRIKRMELIDENANKVNGAEQHQNRVNDIIKLCTDDFEWYLELWPAYYKAVYCLAKINLKTDDSKCRALLLQLPRKANDVEKKLSLFDIHRNRNLFKVKSAHQLDVIHNRASFNKYMEKCVKLLIEYLASKRNPHLQFVLASQWCRLAQPTASATSSSSASSSSVASLNRQQSNRLFEMILEQFIKTASAYVQQINRNAAKSKTFGDFLQSLYGLYKACEVQLCQPNYFPAFSKIMIACYQLYTNTGHSNDNTNNDAAMVATIPNDSDNDDGSVEFQKALDFGAKKMNEKLLLQMDKNAKKPSNKDTQQTQ